FEGEGALIQSDFLNGLSKTEAIDKMIQFLEEKGLGEKKVQYRLRDWLFSRQRYWGEPIPVVHYSDGSTEALADDELPLLLPQVADYEPSEQGEPPLARIEEFVNYTNSRTQLQGKRCTDTMPGSAGSSWYFLRFIDPHNSSAPFATEADRYWMPVDLYMGGPEHTVGHLLYARFWQKVLFDSGLSQFDEPFLRLAHQGDVLGHDGRRMSKSRGNVINLDEVYEKYGADACRVYICFMGPFEKAKPWSSQGIEGVRRFLERVWRLCVDEEGNSIVNQNSPSQELVKLLHKTIEKVGQDIESLNFNTAISAMMILVNEMYKENSHSTTILRPFLQLLMPFAPHIAEELWHRLGEAELISLSSWPQFDPKLTQDEFVTMGVQVNGKMRGTIDISPKSSEENALVLAKSLTAVANAIKGKTLIKVIYKPGKILNIIVK
ncbi:MAG: class I tRNA ligase family protein, partial [Bdellovibrionales bacterium]|nr:class I tRNA ligase family protein [Bdellovibrionales bacterium]